MKSDLQQPYIKNNIKYLPSYERDKFIQLLSEYPESFFKPKNTYLDSNGFERINMTWDMDALERLNEFGNIWIEPWEFWFCDNPDKIVIPWNEWESHHRIYCLHTLLELKKAGKLYVPTASWYKTYNYSFKKGTLQKWHYPSEVSLSSPWISYMKSKKP